MDVKTRWIRVRAIVLARLANFVDGNAAVRADIAREGYATGKSLRAQFLRAPLEFRRISSTFGTRFHPILGRWKAHKGTDYAASPGTPVRAIGDAVVQRAGWSNGYGNLLELRHELLVDVEPAGGVEDHDVEPCLARLLEPEPRRVGVRARARPLVVGAIGDDDCHRRAAADAAVQRSERQRVRGRCAHGSDALEA